MGLQTPQQLGFEGILRIGSAVVPVLVKGGVSFENESYTFKKYMSKRTATYTYGEGQTLSLEIQDTHPLLNTLLYDASSATGGNVPHIGEVFPLTVAEEVVLTATPLAGSEVITQRVGNIASGNVTKIFTQVTAAAAINEYVLAVATATFGAGSLAIADIVIIDYLEDQAVTGVELTYPAGVVTTSRIVSIITGNLNTLTGVFDPDGGSWYFPSVTRIGKPDLPLGGGGEPEPVTVEFSIQSDFKQYFATE